jgi:hypothetical protein
LSAAHTEAGALTVHGQENIRAAGPKEPAPLVKADGVELHSRKLARAVKACAKIRIGEAFPPTLANRTTQAGDAAQNLRRSTAFPGARLFSFLLALADIAHQITPMKNSTKILFSILAAAICTVTFAADKPSCKKTGKNCPMNDNKECNCGKSCDCAK